MSSLCVVEGYSLQLLSRTSHSSGSEYAGEWMSELLPLTGDQLCVSLRISAPEEFAVRAELFNGGKSKIAYEATTRSSENGIDLFAMFEVKLSEAEGGGTPVRMVQLVVYVSQNVAIKTATMTSGPCPHSGMYCIYLSHLSKVTKVVRLTPITLLHLWFYFLSQKFGLVDHI